MKSQPAPHIPIAYDLQGAAAAIGRSVATIKAAVAAGDLTPRFPDTHPLYLDEDLREWARNLPVDPPGRSS